jgi:hypothetical protein
MKFLWQETENNRKREFSSRVSSFTTSPFDGRLLGAILVDSEAMDFLQVIGDLPFAGFQQIGVPNQNAKPRLILISCTIFKHAHQMPLSNSAEE